MYLCWFISIYFGIALAYIFGMVNKQYNTIIYNPGGGGGGGALWYLRGGGDAYARYQKIKNTSKALISGQKNTLIFAIRWRFPVNKKPFFYQNTDIGWTGTRILILDFIILCLFSGSRLGSPVTSRVTRRHSRVYSVNCKGICTPVFRTWVQKVPFSYKIAEILKRPLLPRNTWRGCGPPLYLRAPPPGFTTKAVKLQKGFT